MHKFQEHAIFFPLPIWAEFFLYESDRRKQILFSANPVSSLWS